MYRFCSNLDGAKRNFIPYVSPSMTLLPCEIVLKIVEHIAHDQYRDTTIWCLSRTCSRLWHMLRHLIYSDVLLETRCIACYKSQINHLVTDHLRYSNIRTLQLGGEPPWQNDGLQSLKLHRCKYKVPLVTAKQWDNALAHDTLRLLRLCSRYLTKMVISTLQNDEGERSRFYGIICDAFSQLYFPRLMAVIVATNKLPRPHPEQGGRPPNKASLFKFKVPESIFISTREEALAQNLYGIREFDMRCEMGAYKSRNIAGSVAFIPWLSPYMAGGLRKLTLRWFWRNNSILIWPLTELSCLQELALERAFIADSFSLALRGDKWPALYSLSLEGVFVDGLEDRWSYVFAACEGRARRGSLKRVRCSETKYSSSFGYSEVDRRTVEQGDEAALFNLRLILGS